MRRQQPKRSVSFVEKKSTEQFEKKTTEQKVTTVSASEPEDEIEIEEVQNQNYSMGKTQFKKVFNLKFGTGPVLGSTVKNQLEEELEKVKQSMKQQKINHQAEIDSLNMQLKDKHAKIMELNLKNEDLSHLINEVCIVANRARAYGANLKENVFKKTKADFKSMEEQLISRLKSSLAEQEKSILESVEGNMENYTSGWVSIQSQLEELGYGNKDIAKNLFE